MTNDEKQFYHKKVIEIQNSFEQMKIEPLNLNHMYHHLGLMSQLLENIVLEVIEGDDNE